MDVRCIVMDMFSQIETYRRSNKTIPYSLDLSLESYRITLYFKHSMYKKYDRVLWISEPIEVGIGKSDELSFVRAIIEIGNRCINQLNSGKP